MFCFLLVIVLLFVSRLFCCLLACFAVIIVFRAMLRVMCALMFGLGTGSSGGLKKIESGSLSQ